MKTSYKLFKFLLIPALVLILSPLSSLADSKKPFVVVIDAGHGGNDVGATDHGVQEKDINLAVALKLGELIKKKLKNTEVVFTRDDDTFISLQNRADIANAAKADLFISIHTNSVDLSNKNRSTVAGASTYVLGLHKDSNNLGVAQRENSVIELDPDDNKRYSGFDPTKDESYIIFEMTQKKNLANSIKFAGEVQKEMVMAGRQSRGVHQAGFWVLWSTAMPSVLIELDFICNPEEAKFLSSKEGQNKLAGAIFNAVKTYEEYYRKNIAATRTDYAEPKIQNTVASIRAEEIDETPETSTGDSTGNPTIDEEGAAVIVASTSDEEIRQHLPSTSQVKSKDPAKRKRRSAKSKEIAETMIAEGEIVVTTEKSMTTVSETVTDIVKKEETPVVASRESGASSGTKPARRQSPEKKRSKKQSISTVYKIQLFTSEEALKANDEVFKGLGPVSYIKEHNIYKYTYGRSEQKSVMETLLASVKERFPEAKVIECISD